MKHITSTTLLRLQTMTDVYLQKNSTSGDQPTQGITCSTLHRKPTFFESFLSDFDEPTPDAPDSPADPGENLDFVSSSNHDSTNFNNLPSEAPVNSLDTLLTSILSDELVPPSDDVLGLPPNPEENSESHLNNHNNGNNYSGTHDNNANDNSNTTNGVPPTPPTGAPFKRAAPAPKDSEASESSPKKPRETRDASDIESETSLQRPPPGAPTATNTGSSPNTTTN